MLRACSYGVDYYLFTWYTPERSVKSAKGLLKVCTSDLCSCNLLCMCVRYVPRELSSGVRWYRLYLTEEHRVTIQQPRYASVYMLYGSTASTPSVFSLKIHVA